MGLRRVAATLLRVAADYLERSARADGRPVVERRDDAIMIGPRCECGHTATAHPGGTCAVRDCACPHYEQIPPTRRSSGVGFAGGFEPSESDSGGYRPGMG